MKTLLKYLFMLLVIVLLGYQSVYFQKLSTRKSTVATKFDANAFANKIWEEQFPAILDTAIEINAFIQAIQQNRAAAFARYSHAIAIGNYRYSLIKVSGKISQINENDMILQVKWQDSLLNIHLATEFVYGNAIRDASGLMEKSVLPNGADLNSISEALNKIVRVAVLPNFKKEAKPDQLVEITGAVELNQQYLKLNELELIPIRIKQLH